MRAAVRHKERYGRQSLVVILLFASRVLIVALAVVYLYLSTQLNFISTQIICIYIYEICEAKQKMHTCMTECKISF